MAIFGYILFVMFSILSVVHGLDNSNALCDQILNEPQPVTINNDRDTVLTNINVTQVLKNLRIDLESKGLMLPNEEYFLTRQIINDIAQFSYIYDEHVIKACQILVDHNDNLHLYVGRSSRQQLSIANRFLSGMQPDNDTGKWKMLMTKVAVFKSNFQPLERKPSDISDNQFESNSFLVREKFERAIEGIDETTLSVSTPWVSANAGYTQTNTDESSSSSEMIYSYARYVCGKKEVEIDPLQLLPSRPFVKKLDAIVGHEYPSNLQRAIDLVKTLNEYGWYVPVHYVLGGSFRIQEETQKTAKSSLEKTSKSLRAGLEASFKSIASVSANTKHDHSDTTRQSNETELSNAQKSSVGANGALDIQSFLTNVENEENWQIIRYIKFYPTLVLLKTSDDWTFVECVKLLRNYYYFDEIKQLQRQIDVEKYMVMMSVAASPIPF